MAAEAQGKSGVGSSQEALTDQEMQELDPDAIQNELEAEGEGEAEASPEEIEAEALEDIEAGEPGGGELSARGRGILARIVLRQTLRAVLAYTRAVVRRMVRVASLRRKLAAASRRGPRAVRALVGPVVLRAMPKPFRRISRRLVGLALRVSFRSIARNAGLASQEIDVAELESEAT